MTLKQTIASLKTYWVIIAGVGSFVASVFLYGVNAGKWQIAQKESRDSVIYYYKASREIMSEAVQYSKMNYDSTRYAIKLLKLYNAKVDLLTASYKQSLALNPHINKDQYLNLTEGMNGLNSRLNELLTMFRHESNIKITPITK